jgi:hypothetical protein
MSKVIILFGLLGERDFNFLLEDEHSDKKILLASIGQNNILILFNVISHFSCCLAIK